jgi:acetate kinase
MKPANSGILTINGGSSSIKFALYQHGEPLHSNGRRSDDCAVRQPHSQDRHGEQRINS